jgi:hypothetical protein
MENEPYRLDKTNKHQRKYFQVFIQFNNILIKFLSLCKIC